MRLVCLFSYRSQALHHGPVRHGPGPAHAHRALSAAAAGCLSPASRGASSLNNPSASRETTEAGSLPQHQFTLGPEG